MVLDSRERATLEERLIEFDERLSHLQPLIARLGGIDQMHSEARSSEKPLVDSR